VSTDPKVNQEYQINQSKRQLFRGKRFCIRLILVKPIKSPGWANPKRKFLGE
jgi:hypothetical protein